MIVQTTAAVAAAGRRRTGSHTAPPSDSPMQFSLRMGVAGRRAAQADLDQLPAMGIVNWLDGQRPMFHHEIEIEAQSAHEFTIDLIFSGEVVGSADFAIIER